MEEEIESTGEQEESNGQSKEERIARLQPYQFKKGQSGNPKGRKPGKSLKEYAKEMLASMTDEERQEYLQGIDKKTIWEMSEGKAKQDMELSGKLSISAVLDELENDRHTTPGQTVEIESSIQDPKQEEGASQIQS